MKAFLALFALLVSAIAVFYPYTTLEGYVYVSFCLIACGLIAFYLHEGLGIAALLDYFREATARRLVLSAATVVTVLVVAWIEQSPMLAVGGSILCVAMMQAAMHGERRRQVA